MSPFWLTPFRSRSYLVTVWVLKRSAPPAVLGTMTSHGREGTSRSPVEHRNRSANVSWNPNSSNYQSLRPASASRPRNSSEPPASSSRNRQLVAGAPFRVLDTVQERVVNTSGETISSANSPMQMRDVAIIRSEGPISSAGGNMSIETPFGPSSSASQPSQAIAQTAGRLPPASGPVFVQDQFALMNPSAAAGSFAPG